MGFKNFQVNMVHKNGGFIFPSDRNTPGHGQSPMLLFSMFVYVLQGTKKYASSRFNTTDYRGQSLGSLAVPQCGKESEDMESLCH